MGTTLSNIAEVSTFCQQDGPSLHGLTALKKCSGFSLNSYLYTGKPLSLIS
jgi:hypothetical protein